MAHIGKLKDKYQLVVVSATSEETIHEVLKSHRLDQFSYVFGREARHNWSNVEGKSPYLVRISYIMGVPLERMVFVGDSDADYRAARQLGLWFIECRSNTTEKGRISLVKSGRADFVLEGDSGSELPSLLDAIEARAKQRI